MPLARYGNRAYVPLLEGVFLGEQEIAIPEGTQETLALLKPYLNPPPLVVVVSGPSGVGKDSVVKRMAEQGCPFHFVVTVTDRDPRPGEVDGVDYFFVSKAEFKHMIEADELLEYAVVYGQGKGVPKKQVRQALASGHDAVMRLDVQGAATLRRCIPQAVSIFLVPPSLDVLVERLRRRPGDSPAQVQERLRMALHEMRQANAFDYVVVNREGELDEAVRQVLAIMAAERRRTGRCPVQL
jgi:guanylate kinase